MPARARERHTPTVTLSSLRRQARGVFTPERTAAYCPPAPSVHVFRRLGRNSSACSTLLDRPSLIPVPRRHRTPTLLQLAALLQLARRPETVNGPPATPRHATGEDPPRTQGTTARSGPAERKDGAGSTSCRASTRPRNMQQVVQQADPAARMRTVRPPGWGAAWGRGAFDVRARSPLAWARGGRGAVRRGCRNIASQGE